MTRDCDSVSLVDGTGLEKFGVPARVPRGNHGTTPLALAQSGTYTIVMVAIKLNQAARQIITKRYPEFSWQMLHRKRAGRQQVRD